MHRKSRFMAASAMRGCTRRFRRVSLQSRPPLGDVDPDVGVEKVAHHSLALLWARGCFRLPLKKSAVVARVSSPAPYKGGLLPSTLKKVGGEPHSAARMPEQDFAAAAVGRFHRPPEDFHLLGIKLKLARNPYPPENFHYETLL